MRNKATRIGIIGCGSISQAYFNGCGLFEDLEMAGCSDLNMETARSKAEENGTCAMPVDELLADPEIDMIVNLTVPKAHEEVCIKVLEAGKHVHTEKPLSIDTASGARILAKGRETGLRVGAAPDTFLGAGFQTCRMLLEKGFIGRPLAGTVMFLGGGPEKWHPNPWFFYQQGGGPMLDLGVYYITALIHLLGPVVSVSAVTSKGWEVRKAGAKDHLGKDIPVEIPTHYSGSLVFANGTIITCCVSFDVKKHCHRPIELYGTEGSMICPDPNTFGGPVELFRPEDGEYKSVPLTFNYKENSRGIGAADMAHAIRSGRPHRCSMEIAYHALDVMKAFERSWEERCVIDLGSTCDQPEPFPSGMLPGMMDD